LCAIYISRFLLSSASEDRVMREEREQKQCLPQFRRVSILVGKPRRWQMKPLMQPANNRGANRMHGWEKEGRAISDASKEIFISPR
jgi:hypothetical protein